ncbi:CHAD domain-containing protein [Novipirellula artificiosorum]|uniref:CHAD domain protein n=1 Tax=Novipirellula artificiosorum TaxID=2528016 RepID=A0A5C6D8A4_9BACT|nr:CHAD domain-containing protein [Novipirellula artificiosorum]TWU33393.1 CHAD domain protein [Novipirellula artificiosorum]
MPFRFRCNESVTKNVRRIATEQIKGAIADLSDPASDRVEAIHQARKRCKQIRGLIRLVRPSMRDVYDLENAHFRDASRKLSGLRDADAMLEAWHAFREYGGSEMNASVTDSVTDNLTKYRETVAEEGFDLDPRIDAFVFEMRVALERVPHWKLQKKGAKAIQAGFYNTYHRGELAMTAACKLRTDENFHEWRKRVKYHGYHLRLLRDLHEKKFRKRAMRLKELSDLLGDDHDLAVLRKLLMEHPDWTGSPSGLFEAIHAIDHRRFGMQHDAIWLGVDCYTYLAKPYRDSVAKRLAAWLQ